MKKSFFFESKVNNNDYLIQDNIGCIQNQSDFIQEFNSLNLFNFINIDLNKKIVILNDKLLSKTEEKEIFLKINRHLSLLYKNLFKLPLFTNELIYFFVNKLNQFKLTIFHNEFDFYNKEKSIFNCKHNIYADKYLSEKKPQSSIVINLKKYINLFNDISFCPHEEMFLDIITEINFYKLYFLDVFKSLIDIANLISEQENKLIKVLRLLFNTTDNRFINKVLNTKLNKFFLVFLYFNFNLKKFKFFSKKIYLIINNLIDIELYIHTNIFNFKKIIWKIISSYINYNFFRTKIIKFNFRLINSISKKYNFQQIQLFDLMQEGNLGLIKAIEKFDISKGYKFSTYATWWIRQSINRFIADYSRTIRLPVHMIETINKINKFSKNYNVLEGENASYCTLSNQLNIPLNKVKRISAINKEPISMDTYLNEDNNTSIKDFLKDEDKKEVLNLISKSQLKMFIFKIFQNLNKRESKVLRMRFGIGYKKTFTLEEIGNIFGITRERIRQIENKALSKLRIQRKLDVFKNFLNEKIED